MDETKYITERDAATMLGYSQRWLANLRRAGRVRHAQLVKGGKVLYLREWLEELVNAMRRDPSNGGPCGITH